MRDRVRVVHLLNRLTGGGMERQVMQIVHGLNASGRFDAGVVVHHATDLAAAHSVGTLPLCVFPLRRLYDGNAFRQARRFACYLREHDVRVVHTHDFYTTTFGIMAGMMAGVPVRVAARRELDVFTGMQRRVERLAYRGACAVVANCDRLGLQLICEGVPPGRVAVIRNGIDPRIVDLTTGVDREAVAAGFGLDPCLRYVLMVANVHNVEKDHELLVRAMGTVASGYGDCGLVIAGNTEPERLARLRRLAADAGIADRVFFTGQCEPARIAALLPLADVCVLASHSEGLPNAILEYMAAGRPVVATAVGGVPELVHHGRTGYLVRAADHAALATRILGLLLEPGLASRLGAAGRQRVVREFSLERTLDETMALYDRLLRNAPPSPAGNN